MKNIRKILDQNGTKKCRAISFIEIDGCCYQLASTSKNSMLDQLMDHLKSVGYPCKHLNVEEINCSYI